MPFSEQGARVSLRIWIGTHNEPASHRAPGPTPPFPGAQESELSYRALLCPGKVLQVFLFISPWVKRSSDLGGPLIPQGTPWMDNVKVY